MKELSHQFQLTLKSNLKFLKRIPAFIKKVNTVAKLNEQDFHRLLLSASEAVNNAMIHGNKLDETKTVIILCEVKTTMLILTVLDEGNGFDVSKIPNPLNRKNRLRERGRGIFLMRTLMDEVVFPEKIDVQKKITSGSVVVLKMERR